MGTSSTVTAGYRYYMGIHMGLCSGPADALLKIKVGDRDAWTGTVTSSGQVFINAPELFGGEDREGGIVGTLDVMMGEANQMPNDYLASKQTGHQPAYRGLFGVVYRGGMVSATNPYIKPWAFKLRRILQGWQGGAGAWYSDKASITLSSGDLGMNPAHIVYECLTNQEWGMAYGAAQIDDTNFRAAADAFHAEGLGLCIKWTQQQQIKDFLQIVMDHAGAVLRQNKRTGLFEIKPIRADYSPEALPLFDESKIVALSSYQRPGITDSVNEITIGYTDVTTGQNGSVTVQNLANITAQGGVVAKTQNYDGIPTSDLAVRLALRDLNAVSTPIAKLRFTVDRNAWDLLPGDVIRFSWAKLGIADMVLRILRISGGTLASGTISIEAAEDVFGLPAAGYAQQQPIGWTDPNTLPAPAVNRVIEEAHYYKVQSGLGASDLAALSPDAGFLAVTAVRPSSDSLNFSILTSSGSGYTDVARGDFCPSGVLVDAINHTETAITLQNLVDGDIVTVGGYAYLGTEIVRVDTFDNSTGAATIGRGVLDSVAAAHPAGTRLYFVQNYLDSDDVERIDGESIDVKLLPKTGRGQLSEASAPIDTVTFDQRVARPYPPGQFRINGEAYPAIIESSTLTISWAHRDRTQQNLEGDESGNIGPEPGVTYTVTLINNIDSSVLQTHTDITDTSKLMDTLPAGEYDITAELSSVRDSLVSRQKHAWPFEYIVPATGPFIVASTITEFSTATSQTRTIPAETLEGDLLVACVMHRDTMTPPAGWLLTEATGVFTDGTVNQYLSIYTKTATASDAGASAVFNQASSQRMATHIILVRHEYPLSVAVSGSFIDETTVTQDMNIAEVAATEANQLAITATSFLYAIATAPNTMNISTGWTQTTPNTSNDTANQIRMGVAHQVISAPTLATGYFTRDSTTGAPVWGSATIIIQANDPYWSDVISLLHFDGDDGSTVMTDETGKTWSSMNGAQISTTDPILGSASLYIDNPGQGTTINQKYVECSDITAFNFGLDDFTVECWIKPAALPASAAYVVGQYATSIPQRSWAIRQSPSGVIDILFSTDGATANIYSSTATVAVGQRAHVAITRDGDTMRLFVDGNIEYTVVETGSLHSSTVAAAIGCMKTTTTAGGGIFGFNGQIDDVRITRGLARYTANFTPVPKPFANQ